MVEKGGRGGRGLERVGESWRGVGKGGGVGRGWERAGEGGRGWKRGEGVGDSRLSTQRATGGLGELHTTACIRIPEGGSKQICVALSTFHSNLPVVL